MSIDEEDASGMNSALLLQKLEALAETDWQALLDGKLLRLVDDQDLQVDTVAATDVLVRGSDFPASTASDLKQRVIRHADEILSRYYRTHPLTEQGFNRQVAEWVRQRGYRCFMALPGQSPAYTFFVEGGEVLAEPAGSPKYPYGVYFELDKKLPEAQWEAAFEKWLLSGAAYQNYRGMNVCRYNC